MQMWCKYYAMLCKCNATVINTMRKLYKCAVKKYYPNALCKCSMQMLCANDPCECSVQMLHMNALCKWSIQMLYAIMLWLCKCYGYTNTMTMQMLWLCKCYGYANDMAMQMLWLCKCYGYANAMAMQILYEYYMNVLWMLIRMHQPFLIVDKQTPVARMPYATNAFSPKVHLLYMATTMARSSISSTLFSTGRPITLSHILSGEAITKQAAESCEGKTKRAQNFWIKFGNSLMKSLSHHNDSLTSSYKSKLRTLHQSGSSTIEALLLIWFLNHAI